MIQDIEFRTQSPMAILLVDDSPPDRVLLQRQIKALWPDCNIVPAGSLQAAYQAFKAQNFDVVVLDLNLPDTIGPNTIGEMRRFNHSTPIIALTGMLTSVTIDEALKQGANNVYPKDRIMDDAFFTVLKRNTAA